MKGYSWEHHRWWLLVKGHLLDGLFLNQERSKLHFKKSLTFSVRKSSQKDYFPKYISKNVILSNKFINMWWHISHRRKSKFYLRNHTNLLLFHNSSISLKKWVKSPKGVKQYYFAKSLKIKLICFFYHFFLCG